MQAVMGLRCTKAKICAWRLMKRYEAMKRGKGSGKTITATARKIAVVILDMLAENAAFDIGKMTDCGLAKKSSDMSVMAATAAEATVKEKPAKRRMCEEKKTALPAKRKKAGQRPVSWLTFYRRRRSTDAWRRVRRGQGSCPTRSFRQSQR
jgi:hypothetical protein